MEMISLAQIQSTKNIAQKHGNPIVPPPDRTSDQKTILARINNSNRQLGLFFGVIFGFILGLILVFTDRLNVAIIGKPDSVTLKILAVILAAAVGGNVCSFFGAWFDIVFGKWTIFDGMRSLYLKWKGRVGEIQGPSAAKNQ